MSLYRRYAQGAPEKVSDFTLTEDNIDQYLKYALDMNDDINWLNHMSDLQYKLEHADELDDELYTKEYIERRIEKVRAKRNGTDADSLEEMKKIKADLFHVNKEIDKVRPLVFDKVEGQKEEHHVRMSDLDDRRKDLEDQVDEFYGHRYPNLKKNMKKIYYIIIDGVDINTVQSCFMQMKQVLLNNKTPEEASNELMDESTTKYNLPSTIWDPIRSKTTRKPKK
jgi:hypothetical protein